MLAERYRAVRSFTMALAAPLTDEDCTVQSMLDASPIKWHLAHTTWFFERFVLAVALSGYHLFDPDYDYLFNSYYEGAGARHPRAERGLLTRPTMAQVRRYREHVDQAMIDLLARFGALGLDEMTAAQSSGFGIGSPCFTALVGIHHEQQHQELMLTDIQHAFFCNPLRPAYAETRRTPGSSLASKGKALAGSEREPIAPRIFPAAVRAVGHPREDSFAFDNERPRHRVFLETFALAPQLVTNGEYLAFLLDGGYERPELWLSDGWSTARAEGWKAPLYWSGPDSEAPHSFSLRGVQPLELAAPVCHVSYYEADAYARWAGARLPSEAEWEVTAEELPLEGNFVESGLYTPAPLASVRPDAGPAQLFGDVWEWTSSPYMPYPGFVTFAGILGEYNGKFMCNQMVLRGGSCATSRTHVRSSYRNFFPPAARWQFTGIRLARFA